MAIRDDFASSMMLVLSKNIAIFASKHHSYSQHFLEVFYFSFTRSGKSIFFQYVRKYRYLKNSYSPKMPEHKNEFTRLCKLSIYTIFIFPPTDYWPLRVVYDNPCIHCIKSRICVSKQTVVNN